MFLSRSCSVGAFSFLPRSFSVPFLVPFEIYWHPPSKTNLSFTFFTQMAKQYLRVTFENFFSSIFKKKIEYFQSVMNLSLERNGKRNKIVPFFVPQFLSVRSWLVALREYLSLHVYYSSLPNKRAGMLFNFRDFSAKNEKHNFQKYKKMFNFLISFERK